MKRIPFLLLMLVFISPMGFSKQIIGVNEQVELPIEGLKLKAKIDSGAKNTSLHALDIKRFEQNGKDWVSFKTTDGEGKLIDLSSPVHRIARIKRHNSPSQERPVILTTVCIANVLRTVEVNLIDRSKLIFPLLIGRSYLDGYFLIDVSLKYTTKPNC